MSRRRDMTPTLERRDGQIETLMRSVAREQAKNRDLRNDLRDSRRETQTALEQLRIVQAQNGRQQSEILLLEAALLKREPPNEEKTAADASNEARGWYRRWFSKINPT